VLSASPALAGLVVGVAERARGLMRTEDVPPPLSGGSTS
jgi:hypothetical protein